MTNLTKMRKNFKESAKEVIDEIMKELLEEQKKIEKINYKIMKHEIIEKLNIKEIMSEIFDESKVLDKIKTKLIKLKKKIMKKRFWDVSDEQETLEGLERKIATEELQRVNKIKAYEIRIELIKDEAKREREVLRIERINKLKTIEGK